MNQLERVRFVTERYGHLQGLRLIPIAVPFLAAAAWRGGYLPWLSGLSDARAARWFFAAFAAALAISWSMGICYRRRFGWVQPRHRPTSILLFLGFLAALLASWRAQTTFEWSIPAPMIVIGAAIALVGLMGGHVRAAYLGVAAACLLFASLGAIGVPFHTRDVLFDCLVGFGLMAVGIADHLLLRGTLEPQPYVRAF